MYGLRVMESVVEEDGVWVWVGMEEEDGLEEVRPSFEKRAWTRVIRLRSSSLCEGFSATDVVLRSFVFRDFLGEDGLVVPTNV